LDIASVVEEKTVKPQL